MFLEKKNVLVRCTMLALFFNVVTFSYSKENSTINRYEFITQPYAKSNAKFLSLQNLNKLDSFIQFLQMQFKDEFLALGAGSILAFETAQNQTAPFGVFFGNAQFTSPYLESKVRLNWYTMKSVNHAEPVDIEFERFKSGKVAPVSGMMDVDFTLPEAYLKFKYKSLSLLIGKEKVRWGPGYKGTLALSGTSLAPFYYYHLRLNLMSRVHLSCFLAGYDDDRRYKNEFTGFDTLKSKNKATSITSLPPRYGVGQRIDVRINDHIQFGIHELCGFYGSNDLTRYANPLQIYYLGYNSGSNEANMMAGCDLNLIFNPIRIYGEFLDDGITILDNKGNPNKYAWQAGVAYNSSKIIQEAGLEYTHVSKYTYGHYSILNRHEYWGEPIAWPWGNDQDVFNLHVLLKCNPQLAVKFEANYWLKGTGTLSDEWLVDGAPDLDKAPYWPENSNKIVSFILGCSYTPKSWMNVTAFYRPSIIKHKMYTDCFLYYTVNIPEKIHLQF